MAAGHIPPLYAQDANRALGLPPGTVGIEIEYRLDFALLRWEVRSTEGRPSGQWVPVEVS